MPIKWLFCKLKKIVYKRDEKTNYSFRNFAGNYLVVQNTEIASENHKSVLINWTLLDVSDAVIFYDIYRNNSFTFENFIKVNSERIYIEDGLNYEFSDENIELGERYYYWITANNYQNTLMVFNPMNIEMNHLEFANFSTSTNSQKVNINWKTVFEIIYNSDAENNLYETSCNFSDDKISQGGNLFLLGKRFCI